MKEQQTNHAQGPAVSVFRKEPEAKSETPPPAVPLPLRSIGAIVSDLRRPIPARHLRKRKQGDQMLTYVPWYIAVKFLDLYASGWSYEVRSVNQIGNRCVIVVRISIPCAEGIAYREATGQELLDCGSYGDPSSNAESMALRRAAAKFGLASHLYEKKEAPSDIRN